MMIWTMLLSGSKIVLLHHHHQHHHLLNSLYEGKVGQHLATLSKIHQSTTGEQNHLTKKKIVKFLVKTQFYSLITDLANHSEDLVCRRVHSQNDYSAPEKIFLKASFKI